MPPMVDATKTSAGKSSRRFATKAGLVLAAAASVTALVLVSGGAPLSAQEQQTILFTSEAPTGGGSALFTVLPDGTGRTQLPSSLERPAAQGDWSPLRTHVAYTSYRDNEWRLNVLDNAANSNQTITTGPEDFEPDWSPDGTRILFTSYFNRDTVDQTSFIMTTAPDGGGARPIVQLVNPNYYIGNPRWSPDGTRVAFTLGSAREGGELYVMNADGTNIRVLLDHPGWDDIDPTWSPDGQRIAFASGEYQGATGRTKHEIWLLDVALGVAGTIIVDDVHDLRRPAWSPDGKRIAFDSLDITPGQRSALYIHIAPSTGGPVGPSVTVGREPDWGTGQLAPTTTPISPPTVTGTTTPVEPSSTPEGTPTVPPPPITQVPTIPPFPTISTPGPTSTGPAPTFPPPTSTPSSSTTPTATETEPSPTTTHTATATGEPGPDGAVFLPVTFRYHDLDGE